jgi:hypothetical protein
MWRFVTMFCIVNLQMDCHEEFVGMFKLVKGKEPTRCDKVCSFIASTCFGHQYAHHQE